MRNYRWSVKIVLVLTALCLSAASGGCGGGNESTDSNVEDVGDTFIDNADTEETTSEPPSDVIPDASPDTSSPPPDTSSPPPDTSSPPIGNPVGDPVAIDHAAVLQAVKANLIKHIDGLDEALTFLETSDSVDNVVDMLAGDEDEEGGEDGEKPKEDEEEGLEIDLSEIRDSILEFITDSVMVENTATLAADGLSLRYDIDPELFCSDEPEENESEEEKADRLKDQAECSERLTKNPIGIDVTSDGDARMNLSLQVGKDAAEVLTLQIHSDMMSVNIDLAKIRHLVEVFVDPEDFSLPATMEGVFACEIRENAALKYSLRCGVVEAINVASDADQDPYELELAQADDMGLITIDGNAKSIVGALHLMALKVSIPWQVVVDMFYDTEGYSEWTCDPNGEGGEDCYDKWIEPEEVPTAEGSFIVSVPSITGALEYAAGDDTFRFTGMSLGESTTTVSVDSEPIIAFDLNPDDGRTMDMTFGKSGADDMSIGLSPKLDAKVTFTWDKVSDVFEELPSFLLNETLGIRFMGADKAVLQLLNGEDSTQLKVASGELTFWSSAMTKDVVIDEGMCITGVDEESMTEEEKEAQHDLFGGLIGAICEP